MARMSPNEVRMINVQYIENIKSGRTEKSAAATSDYTKLRMLDEVVVRQILPPETLTPADIDRLVDTQVPVKIVDMAPDAPAAISAPLGSAPVNIFLKGQRYMVVMSHIHSPMFTYDTAVLATYDAPVSELIGERLVQELGSREDGAFFAMVRAIWKDSAGVQHYPNDATPYTIPWTGVVQSGNYSALNRQSVMRASVIMSNTPYMLQATRAVVAASTMAEIYSWGRDQAGGDVSQDLLQAKLSVDIAGLKWIVTRKWSQAFMNVGSNYDDIYFFADPDYLGKFFELQSPKTVIKNEEPFISVRAYETAGFSIGNIAGVAWARFGRS